MNKFSKVVLGALIISNVANAQKDVPKNWHLQDPTTSGYNGISLNKAYDLIKAKKLKSNRVTVAVIDSGIDTLHEDLKPVLWRNPKEIPGNGIDDDKNGYIDDINGWNFLGGKDGKNVNEDSYEAARVYYRFKAKWEGKTVLDAITKADKKEFADYTRAKAKVVGEVDEKQIDQLKFMLGKLTVGDSILKKELGKDEYNVTDVEKYSGSNNDAKMAKAILTNISKANNTTDITNKQLLDELKGELKKSDAASNPPKEYRKEIVGDDETNVNDRNYGNNDLMAGTPFHGTHCSGIIGAVRNNGKGIDGIADNVRIMMLRAVPDGDEHDKDIANAIRYAVDNGAQVISMSFGKDFSPEKHWVDEAYKYAASKNVLLVHAAGNDSKNVDTTYNFPNPFYLDGSGRADNLITVGASGDKKNGGLTASFSNYGAKEVDLFAPGVNIHSTIPGGNTYGDASGTSMACPVVAGVAALIMQYYPTLTAVQVKEAIEKSVVKSKEKVNNPETKQKVELSTLSKTGGFVNAFEAIKYAEVLSKAKSNAVPKIRKSAKG
jgi:cell wall-associated protease